MISIIFNLLDVLIVLVPVLLAVAYMTIIERRVLAGMQRRVGPNVVGGPSGWLQPFLELAYSIISHRFMYFKFWFTLKFNKYIKGSSNTQKIILINPTKNSKKQSTIIFKRKFSTQINNKDININSINIDKAIETLYRDRKILPTPYNGHVLDFMLASDYFDLLKRRNFLRNWNGKNVIYLIQYKHDPLIYYIGKTSNLALRIKTHLTKYNKINSNLHTRFQSFISLAGVDQFIIKIINETSKLEINKLENKLILEYNPLLNTNFHSIPKSLVTNTFKENLLKLQSESILSNKGNLKNGYSVWVYKYNPEEKKSVLVGSYPSLLRAQKATFINRNVIRLYLNTNVTIKEFLFYTEAISNFSQTMDLISNLRTNFSFDLTKSKPVYVYSLDTLNLITGDCFESREKASQYLGIHTSVIRNNMDKVKYENNHGYLFFSYPLTLEELNVFKSEFKKLPNFNKVWAYNAQTLNLVNNKHFSSWASLARYLNIDYKTIKNNLDTFKAIFCNLEWIYFFKKELTLEQKENLKKNFTKARQNVNPVWVNIVSNKNKITPYNNNSPNFSSLLEIEKELKISAKKVRKIIDTGVSYKGFLFYSSQPSC